MQVILILLNSRYEIMIAAKSCPTHEIGKLLLYHTYEIATDLMYEMGVLLLCQTDEMLSRPYEF